MSHDEEIGAFVRSVPVPPQANDPDVTVVRLDLHTDGFVVRCEIGGGRLGPVGLVAVELRDSLSTPYDHAGFGSDFVKYKPAIPANAEWVEVLTTPKTHVDLVESH
jgi:hypothetical protein